jgi:hypothetical protein
MPPFPSLACAATQRETVEKSIKILQNQFSSSCSKKAGPKENFPKKIRPIIKLFHGFTYTAVKVCPLQVAA